MLGADVIVFSCVTTESPGRGLSPAAQVPTSPEPSLCSAQAPSCPAGWRVRLVPGEWPLQASREEAGPSLSLCAQKQEPEITRSRGKQSADLCVSHTPSRCERDRATCCVTRRGGGTADLLTHLSRPLLWGAPPFPGHRSGGSSSSCHLFGFSSVRLGDG